MAEKTWKITSEARMERHEYDSEDDYKLYGSGNLKGCKSYIYNRKKYNELYFCGHFDTIEDGCFNSNTIKYVRFSNGSFKHLGNECFRSTKLEDITLPESLETIGHNNFNGVFTSFRIPSKVEIFPADNLKDCNKLTSISVSENNTAYKSVDGILFNYDMTEIVFCPNAKSGRVIIPSSVKRIGDYCFYGCKSLKLISIPTSVESIGIAAFSEIDIEKLIIPNSVEKIGSDCFANSKIRISLKLSTKIKKLPNSLFYNSDIASFHFNFSNVEVVGANAIGNITKDIMPVKVSFNNLKRIENEAFDFCNETKIFEFFSSLEHINGCPFSNCHKNLIIRYFGYSPIAINNDAFRDVSDNATLVVPIGTKQIFENASPWSSFTNIEEWDIAIDKDEEGNEIEVSDEVCASRLKSLADSKTRIDRHFLKQIVSDVCLNYQYVDSDKEYEEALQLFSFNNSFSPCLVSNIEQEICQTWTNKYKLRILSKIISETSSATFVRPPQIEGTIVDASLMALPLDVVDKDSSVIVKTQTEVFFNKDILRVIQNNLALAQNNIKIAVSWFTNYALFKQLQEMAGNVKIQLIINNDLTNNGGYCLDFNELISNGVEISLVEYPHLLHHKFCIIDDNIIIDGSYNWTRFSEKNYENIVVIKEDEDLIAEFNDEFSNIWDKAEHKCIDKMPEYVPERPEYDRSAFKQYVTEELDAEARETSNERDKITALQKAVKLNSSYLEVINPTVKSKYAEAFKAMDDSITFQKKIVALVGDSGRCDKSTESAQICKETTNKSVSANKTDKHTTISSSTAVLSRQEVSVIETIKASDLLMVLDVSGSMKETYAKGHVHNISKKALSASIVITDNKEVSLWKFGKDATFFGNIGIDGISKIENIKCQNEGTNLVKFVEKANSAIKDNALVVVFTDDDLKSINNALPGMKQRANVFWQIIVYGKSIDSLKASLADAQNTSVLSMTNYTKMSNDEISQVLLRDYINWKKHR